jgi:3-methyl-2-oxobutanoate hydroxymethyltransferase
VDGQVLVMHDMLGLNSEFSPRFLRRYLQLDGLVTEAVQAYIRDVRSGDFPSPAEQY